MTLAAPASAVPSPVGRGTLGRRLVIRVAAVVALASLLLAGASFLATRQILLAGTDAQLDTAMSRLGRPTPGGVNDDDDNPRGIAMPGQPIGTVILEVQDARVVRGAILREAGADATISLNSLAELLRVMADGRKHTVTLPGLGSYRFGVVSRGESQTLVGLSLGAVDHTLRELLALDALLTLVAIGGAILITRSVVATNLRPLHEVAATATRVSELSLHEGEVDLSVRVPPGLTHPENEVSRVANALNHMLNNVESALAARQASETKVRQFVADASHELRNPLAAIRGYAELTRRHRQDLPPDTQFAIGRIESESERMSRLVEDMLLLARIDAGPVLQLADVDLREVLVDAVADAQVAGPDHAWRLDLPDAPVVVPGDRFRLHQVVANLLANARTHTPAGTQVVAGLATAADRAVITVTDDGPGIPEDLVGRVFERFVRADVARARQSGTSTGLGLAIVAAVVHAHHGSASVTSEPGRTTFRIDLPLAAAD